MCKTRWSSTFSNCLLQFYWAKSFRLKDLHYISHRYRPYWQLCPETEIALPLFMWKREGTAPIEFTRVAVCNERKCLQIIRSCLSHSLGLQLRDEHSGTLQATISTRAHGKRMTKVFCSVLGIRNFVRLAWLWSNEGLWQLSGGYIVFVFWREEEIILSVCWNLPQFCLLTANENK